MHVRELVLVQALEQRNKVWDRLTSADSIAQAIYDCLLMIRS